MNQVSCKNLKTTNVKVKSESLAKVNSVENMRNLLKMSTKKEINHMVISCDLLQLAEIEQSHENLKMSTFCKFQSVQILMNNKS